VPLRLCCAGVPPVFLSPAVSPSGVSSAPPVPASSSPSSPLSSSPLSSSPEPASPESASPESGSSPSDYRVTFGFAVPSGAVRVPHAFTAPPLRTLVGVYAGNHPDGPYQEMSFYFRGGYPTYQVSYVPSVVSDPRGEPVSLPGNASLQVVFTDAPASVPHRHHRSGTRTWRGTRRPATSRVTSRTGQGSWRGRTRTRCCRCGSVS
jgi:hypothetical protein